MFKVYGNTIRSACIVAKRPRRCLGEREIRHRLSLLPPTDGGSQYTRRDRVGLAAPPARTFPDRLRKKNLLSASGAPLPWADHGRLSRLALINDQKKSLDQRGIPSALFKGELKTGNGEDNAWPSRAARRKSASGKMILMLRGKMFFISDGKQFFI